MTNLPPFLFQYLYYIEILMLIAGVIIAISSTDDLFVDLMYWSRRLFGTSGSRSRELPSFELLEQLPERPFAIMIPCWKEHDVIFSMRRDAFQEKINHIPVRIKDGNAVPGHHILEGK